MNNIYAKLAGTNIRNNRQLYLPYILSGIMTVAMFYLMLFINNNPGIDKIPGAANLKTIMALGVGVITIFSYIFIFYTNSFISKRRKKEIGIYNILGMEKRHIAKVLALETVFVAVITILGGLAAGIVFSKLVLMLLYRILGFDETVMFFITGSGIRATLIVFGILYVLTLIYNLMQITFAKPIELLRGGNVGEKEPKTKWLMAIAGAACIATAYYIAITTENPMKVLTLFFVAVLLVIAGTYFLFTAGSIAVLKMLRNNKNFYYNKKHFAAVSGMLYRMKQNAAGLASICVLSTMVLVMVSTTVSMFAGVQDELAARYPQEITLYSTYDNVFEGKDDMTDLVKQTIADQGRTIENECSYRYLLLLLTRNDTSFEAAAQDTWNSDLTMINVITRDDLIAMDDRFTENDISQPQSGTVSVYGSKAYDADTITILGKEFQVGESRVFMADKDMYASLGFNDDYYVVVDSLDTLKDIFALANTDNRITLYRGVSGYDIDGTTAEKTACADAVNEAIQAANEKAGLYKEDTVTNGLTSRYMESRSANENEFYSIYGGLFFLGVFLGIMFLMVTVMIIFYKQISEGYDDKQRYEIMEKVGMSNEEVKTSIQSQIRMVFFLPIVTAAIHVAAAFPMINRLLMLLNLTNTRLFIICLIITILIFTLIYYIVFKLTSRSYYKIVGNQVR